MAWYDIILRLIIAMILGGLVGYERESENRPAGFRTHILVCIGAAVTTMLESNMAADVIKQVTLNPSLAGVIKIDMGRIGAQVITGVGFLGAGTILHERGSVKGLTSAASIWVVACVGLAIGYGYYLLSIFTVIGAYIVMSFLKKFESKFIDKVKQVKLEFEFSDKKQFVIQVEEYFEERKIKIKNIEFLLEDNSENNIKRCLYTVLVPKVYKDSEVVAALTKLEAVVNASEQN